MRFDARFHLAVLMLSVAALFSGCVPNAPVLAINSNSHIFNSESEVWTLEIWSSVENAQELTFSLSPSSGVNLDKTEGTSNGPSDKVPIAVSIVPAQLPAPGESGVIVITSNGGTQNVSLVVRGAGNEGEATDGEPAGDGEGELEGEFTSCVDRVVFTDPNLRAAVREAIDRPEGDIRPQDLAGLTNLDASEANIVRLDGLQCCPDLETLVLTRNQISNLTPLGGLFTLTLLDLGENLVSNLGPLSTLENLHDLNLEDNRVSDVSPLTGLSNLQWLHLGGNLIEGDAPIEAIAQIQSLRDLYLNYNDLGDVDPLANLTALETLSLEGAQVNVADLDPLGTMVWLQELQLAGTEITFIGFVETLVNLHTLGLWSNNIANISVLEALTKLQWLGLDDNEVADLSPLSGLTELETLYLRGNLIIRIDALTENTGLGQDDYLDLRENGLNQDALCQHIPELLCRGVDVEYDGECETPPEGESEGEC